MSQKPGNRAVTDQRGHVGGLYAGLLLLALAVIAIALRLHALDSQSLFRDEGHTLQQAQSDWRSLAVSAAHDAHPLLYWLVLRVWAAGFGTSIWSLRLLSAVCGIGVWVLLVILARRYGGRRGALYAGALGAPSLHLIASAQEARPYAFFALVLLGSLLALSWALERSTARRWAVFALLAACLLYTDYLAVTLLLLAVVFLPAKARPAVLAAGVLWAPGCCQLVLLGLNVTSAGRETLSAEQAAFLFFDLPATMLTGSGINSPVRSGLAAASIAAYGFLVWNASGFVKRSLAALSLALTASILLTCLWGIAASGHSRASMLTPVVLLIVAVAASQQPLQRAIPAIVLLGALGGIDLMRGFYTRPRQGGWKQLAAWLQASAERRAVYAPSFNLAMLRYYYPAAREWFDSSPPTAPFIFASDRAADCARLASARRRRFVNVFVAEVTEAPIVPAQRPNPFPE